ncbi:hypothetical protein GOP47_0011602 [Adiantum capillus-veneris]|uniref:Uncharacterized protein n=1 Tax=Adiantum capillus-veneris TaxID=13818 RepID=A0A9D4UTI0_ADICA|nr:hypothetical protein GOP47_0011602 [Adiantum capillus-veneris]
MKPWQLKACSENQEVEEKSSMALSGFQSDLCMSTSSGDDDSAPWTDDEEERRLEEGIAIEDGVADPIWGRSSGSSPPAESEFFNKLASFEDLGGGRLRIRGNDGKAYVGSATLLCSPFLTQNGKYRTFWVTALHNLEGGNGYAQCTVNPEVLQLPNYNISAFSLSIDVLKRGDRDFVGLFNSQDFSSSTSKVGSKRSKVDRAMKRGYPSFLFFSCDSSNKDWVNAKVAWPHGDLLQPLDLVVRLGYPGVVTFDKFKQYHGSGMNDAQVKKALGDIRKFVLMESVFSIAPAEVHLVGADHRLIKDNGSSWGGMSGGAVLNLRNPKLLEDFRRYFEMFWKILECRGWQRDAASVVTNQPILLECGTIGESNAK